MRKTFLVATMALSFLALPALGKNKISSSKQFFAKDGIVTTQDNYATLETSRQLLINQEKVGLNKFEHKRELTPTNSQPVVRMNRDTYYSFAVVDVSKGAFITLPKIPKGKYMSLQLVTEDHRIPPMKYGAGKYNLTTHFGSHVYAIIRLDATFTKDEAKKYQDQMSVTSNSNNMFNALPVNKKSFYEVENALKAKTPKLLKENPTEALFGMFTAPTDASEKLFTKEKYALGAALGWGGAQLIDNIYEISGNYPADKCHQMTFEDPKNKAFWSVTVYNKTGFMFNDLANLNSNTAKRNKNGTYTVSYGCGNKAINNIPTKNDSGVFNLAMRHYIPSERVRVKGYRLVPFMKLK